MTDQPAPTGEAVSETSSEKADGEEVSTPADNTGDSLVDRFSEMTIIDQKDESTDVSTQVPSVEATHIIVLVHGWMGNTAEMGYIRKAIENAANGTNNSEGSTRTINHRFIIHSPACNVDKTDDGIAVGGSRLAHEINDLVKRVVKDTFESDCYKDTKIKPSKKFTLSIVGNSLGGLYARHALAGIDWDIGGSESSAPPVMLIPMVFVTTATPHLGISQHTYVPLPRAAEFVVAQGMKETGRDFFRFTQVIEDLFSKDYFINPLSSFQQRIAYINIYGTDFQVPTATAAFWAADSDSPHHRVKESTEETVGNIESKPKSIVMTLTTPRVLESSTEVQEKVAEEKKMEEGEDKEDSKKNDKTEPSDVYTSWSKRLDGLGWTKVLVDVRDDVPDVRESIQTVIDGSSSEESGDEANDTGSKTSDSDPKEEEQVDDKSDNDKEQNSSEDEKTEVPEEENIAETVEEEEEEVEEDVAPDWTTKETWTAGELLAEFKGNILMAQSTKPKRRSSFWDLKPKLPLGHTVMIANAKDEFNKKVTSGGKPVMDYLGASLVRTLQESVPTRTDSKVELHEC